MPYFQAKGRRTLTKSPSWPELWHNPAVGWPDGVQAPLAPRRKQKPGADGAQPLVRLGVAVRLGLDAAAEGGLAQVAEADGGDVEVDRGRDVVAYGHVDAQAFERRFLAKVPPGIHQVPGHRGVLRLVLRLVRAGYGRPAEEDKGQDDEGSRRRLMDLVPGGSTRLPSAGALESIPALDY